MKKFLIIISIISTACEQRQNAIVDSTTLSFNVSKPVNDIRLSEIVTNDVKYIIPDTSAIIGFAMKVIYYNSKLFIYDRYQNKIIIINDDGGFVGEISQEGRGPGEYIRINDFIVNKYDNTIELYDRQQESKIITYNFAGDFLREIFIKEPFDAFEWLEPNYIFLNLMPRKEKDYYLTLIDKSGNVVSKILKIPYAFDKDRFSYVALPQYFNSFDKDISISIPGNRVVYTIDENLQAVSKYSLDFQDGSDLLDGFYPSTVDEREEISKSHKNVVSWIQRYMESDNYVYMGYIQGDNTIRRILYSKISNKYYNWFGNRVINDVDGLPFHVVGIYNNTFLVWTTANACSKLYNREGLANKKISSEQLDNIDNSGNIIFALYQIKDF